MLISAHLVRVLIIGEQEQETFIRRQHIPHPEIAGGGSHFAVEIVPEILINVFVKIVNGTPLQQPRLIRIALTLKIVDSISGGDPAALERNILGDDIHDLLLEHHGGKVRCVSHIDVQSRSQGTGHLCPGIGPKPVQGQEDHKLSRAHISILAGGIAVTNQVDLTTGSSHRPTGIVIVALSVLFP